MASQAAMGGYEDHARRVEGDRVITQALLSRPGASLRFNGLDSRAA